jgi:hypothetical protein
MTFRDLRARLEPVAGLRPESMVALMRRLRWPSAWEGSGPFCLRALQRSLDRTSLRDCCRAIDAANPPTSLRGAFGRMGFPLGGGVTTRPPGDLSLHSAARRVLAPDVVSLRFLSYNTYLLPGPQIPFGDWIDDAVGWDALRWFGIPFGSELLVLLGIVSIPTLAVAAILKLAGVTPSSVIRTFTLIDLNAIRFGAKPALNERALEMGPVFGAYDICCLCEVFVDDTRARIVAGLGGGNWQSAAGPDASGAWIALESGLFFLARNRNITRTERMVYENRGERIRDADAWSNKGAMLNEIDLGFGKIEFFQTHFFYGGGLPLVDDPTPQERMAVWRDELRQLAEFYRDHHRAGNVAVITGDFNLSGANLQEYVEVRRVMDSLGLRDLWAWDVYGNEPSEGITSRFTDGDEAGWVRDFDGQCFYTPSRADPQSCDDHAAMPAAPRAGVGRYDFVFMQMPAPDQTVRVEVSRSVRRPFKRAQPTEGEAFLSDHMGMDLTLFVSPA